ncbi:sugar kinase [Alteromonas sp. 14N.309.X.WAT.G.H12]|uniref:sugar kinase n=1 Tax=Alteromonas sp. 14N.309.X.WAT.G.H12 TaxID=3120824 RepID=UPI002FD67EE1
MTSLLCIGEGMLELRPQQARQFKCGYAGDTLNAAIYAKRINPDLTVSFLTGIGQDPYSADFITFCQQESLNTKLLLTSKTANLGIYAIATDDAGERSFYYWRKGSAATQLMNLIDEYGGKEAIDVPSMVFFSGLALGFLSDGDKPRLLQLIEYFKDKGSQIAFDPNYRPMLWKSPAHTIEWLNFAYEVSDLILPGLDEHQVLFGHQTAEEVAEYMSRFEFDELIIKCGDEGVKGYDKTGLVHHQPFNPAPTQIDSTAAGDSFAGTYLAKRLCHCSMAEGMKQADSVARFVVQHSGAIVDGGIFQRFLETDN